MDYNKLATDSQIKKATDALIEHGFKVEVVENKEEALEKIKTFIPVGSEVMNGGSTTLEEIGYMEYLRAGKHEWKDLHAAVTAENDPVKRGELRKLSINAAYYLGSAHAISETGEIVIASNTGSQLPHIAFSSQNVILIVSTKKIVPTLVDAFERVEKHIVPLEDERMKQVFGVGTLYSKTLILHHENPMMQRNFLVLFVKENLGF